MSCFTHSFAGSEAKFSPAAEKENWMIRVRIYSLSVFRPLFFLPPLAPLFECVGAERLLARASADAQRGGKLHDKEILVSEQKQTERFCEANGDTSGD